MALLTDVEDQRNFPVPAGQELVLANGPGNEEKRTLRTLDDLSAAVNSIDPEIFEMHVTRDKNDFADWVQQVFGEEQLAAQLRGFPTPLRMMISIEKFLRYNKPRPPAKASPEAHEPHSPPEATRRVEATSQAQEPHLPAEAPMEAPMEAPAETPHEVQPGTKIGGRIIYKDAVEIPSFQKIMLGHELPPPNPELLKPRRGELPLRNLRSIAINSLLEPLQDDGEGQEQEGQEQKGQKREDTGPEEDTDVIEV